MPSLEAVVDTSRAQRYLDQFAKHFAHRPGGMQATLGSDGHLLLELGRGTCRLQAAPRALLLRVEAADAEQLDVIKRRITERVEQLGRRDSLQVCWLPPEAEAVS